MPHFSEDLSAEDPDLLRRLRTLLRDDAPPPQDRPRWEERFGLGAAEEPGAASTGPGRSPAGPARRIRRPVTT
jgi:hypothetical protein